jgi:enoyl reductase-like protein
MRKHLKYVSRYAITSAMQLMDGPPEQPEEVATSICEAAYQDFFEGMVFRDVKQIREAVHCLGRTTLPGVHTLGRVERQLEALWSRDDATREEWLKTVTAGLAWALRSYVYSGIPLQPGTVSVVTSYFKKDESWLRDKLYPSKDSVRNLYGVQTMSSAEYHVKRDIVINGMQQLGLVDRYDRLRIRRRKNG